jgi:hypothetical protein
MSYYEAVAAKNIATKTSTFENERVNIFYSKASGAYTLVEK